jgi:hypothetical protein
MRQSTTTSDEAMLDMLPGGVGCDGEMVNGAAS